MSQNKEISNVPKDRSYRACISCAIKSTIKELPGIIKKRWKMVLTIALLQGVLFAWALSLSPGMLYVGFELHPYSIFLACLSAFALHLIIYGFCFSFLNGENTTWNVLRALKTVPISASFFLLYIIAAVVISLFYINSCKSPENIPLLNIILLTTFTLPFLYIITLPLFYVYTRYQIEKDAKLVKSFTKAYITGFRYWGFIFIIQFLSALCLVVFEFTICLPQYILIVSQNASAIGTASLGDISDLPRYFYALSALIGIIYGGIRIFEVFFIANVANNCYQTITIRRTKAKKNI